MLNTEQENRKFNMKKATKNDWELFPLPDKHVSLIVSRKFDRCQMDRIQMGVVPHDMDERWLIYYEDDTLYLHRSWTGYCTFAVRFIVLDDGAARMCECLASRDEEQYGSSNDAEDLKLLNSIIDELLLGIL